MTCRRMAAAGWRRVLLVAAVAVLWAAAASAQGILSGLDDDLARVSRHFPVPSSHFGEDYAMAVSTEGNLFMRVREGYKIQSRGAFQRLGMYLMHTASPFPPFYAGFGGISRDAYKDRHFASAPFFSFCRANRGRFPTLLWPDVDTYGWPQAWIAPHALVQGALRADSVPWAERDPRMIWPGKVLSKTRKVVAECAAAHPDDIHHQDPDWEAWQNNATKPPAGDLRAILRHAFALTLPGMRGSTSSLKRAASAGGVLVMPRRPAYVDLAFRALESSCPDCWAAVDTDDLRGLCASLLRVRRSLSGGAGELMAARLSAFAASELSAAAYERYAHSALAGLSRIQRHVPDRVLLAAGFQRVTCESVAADLVREVEPRLFWQVDLWYNLTTCTPNPAAAAAVASMPL